VSDELDADCPSTSISVAFEVRAKHGDLWAAAKKLGSVKALASYLGVHHNNVHQWIKMYRVPGFKSTQAAALRAWTPEKKAEFEKRLIAITGKTIEEIWPNAVFSREFLEIEKDIEVVQEVDLRHLALRTESLLKLPAPESEIEREETVESVKTAMKQLNARSREIISRRFGFDGPQEDLETIGKSLKLSKERVRQIESQALNTLRYHVEE
jgi:RNA polymerase sigma factor (sigma-70 family)